MSVPMRPPPWPELTANGTQCSPLGSLRPSFSRPLSSLRSASVASVASVSGTSFTSRLNFSVIYNHTDEVGYDKSREVAKVFLAVEPCMTGAKSDPIWILMWYFNGPIPFMLSASLVASWPQHNIKAESPRGKSYV
ncbi:uncharacterized protein PHACADRAFT_212760 [Phanerochaete carnosa HHB-10118-sp]|uniref:Uncharacterized protein n=1 Tax=Phanerochaete carnosa (strain HHB-10118-sp) TaxID=650164 RepID=K5VL90_PHACS|nr:uncharacterized protein PHACADRAFT_212760 [Phanerochaete carnosa HHB-10118-sp]EKM52188.1 hypothetical protein PHACADRAFT_212760 [Phanerochaete carnosa HHB-10118-sp]